MKPLLSFLAGLLTGSLLVIALIRHCERDDWSIRYD
jgi:hypothetical protein